MQTNVFTSMHTHVFILVDIPLHIPPDMIIIASGILISQ